MSVLDFSMLDKVEPDKNLTAGKRRISGRSGGSIAVAHRGGGAKRLYRSVDFNGRASLDNPAVVETIEYDPNRSAFIAKIAYTDGKKSYIVAPEGLEKGQQIVCADEAPAVVGNRMKLKNVPVGSAIHNIELVNGKGGQIVRSAGNSATILGVDGKYAIVRLPSGETRKILAENFASIGIVSNGDHSNITLSKAGRVRAMGIRPTVRGKAKNPIDHPHGGGEGNTSIGIKKGPKTPWGAPALGRRTRNKKKASGALILSRRKK